MIDGELGSRERKPSVLPNEVIETSGVSAGEEEATAALCGACGMAAERERAVLRHARITVARLHNVDVVDCNTDEVMNECVNARDEKKRYN